MHPRSIVAVFALAVSSLTIGNADAQCVYQEVDGIVMMEVESVPTAGDWVEESDVPGYTGTGFFRWNGPNYWSTPGHGVISYFFEIFSPGTYKLSIRNYYDDPKGLENDVWVRLDGGQWIKAYSPIDDQWTLYVVFQIDGIPTPAEYALSAGQHQLDLSGRSSNFRIDRIHLYLDSNPSEFQPPSLCADEVPGTPFCFGVGCPCGNDNPTRGCLNSSGTGALLDGSGSTSVAADDLVLTTVGCPPNNTGLYFMGGNTFSPVLLGDGLACTGGIFRYFPGVVGADGIFVQATPIASAFPGAITIGDTRHFQSWTRDVTCGPPPAPCPTPCGNNSNVSNGYSVTFTP